VAGAYYAHVLVDGQPIAESPFTLHAEGPQIDASR
jgi:hypothetical protein